MICLQQSSYFIIQQRELDSLLVLSSCSTWYRTYSHMASLWKPILLQQDSQRRGEDRVCANGKSCTRTKGKSLSCVFCHSKYIGTSSAERQGHDLCVAGVFLDNPGNLVWASSQQRLSATTAGNWQLQPTLGSRLITTSHVNGFRVRHMAENRGAGVSWYVKHVVNRK